MRYLIQLPPNQVPLYASRGVTANINISGLFIPPSSPQDKLHRTRYDGWQSIWIYLWLPGEWAQVRSLPHLSLIKKG